MLRTNCILHFLKKDKKKDYATIMLQYNLFSHSKFGNLFQKYRIEILLLFAIIKKKRQRNIHVSPDDENSDREFVGGRETRDATVTKPING